MNRHKVRHPADLVGVGIVANNTVRPSKLASEVLPDIAACVRG